MHKIRWRTVFESLRQLTGNEHRFPGYAEH